MRHLLVPFLLGLCGCELYFTDPPEQDAASLAPSPVDAGSPCQFPPPVNLMGIITAPAEGAIVQRPVDVIWRWSDPSQDASKITSLVDEQGNQVGPDHPCATMPTGADQVSCFSTLAPNTTYTFRMDFICWGGTPPMIPIAQRTFVTAP